MESFTQREGQQAKSSLGRVGRRTQRDSLNSKCRVGARAGFEGSVMHLFGTYEGFGLRLVRSAGCYTQSCSDAYAE